MTVRAAVDAQGKVTAWDFLDRSFPWSEEGNPLLASRQIGQKPTEVGFANGNGGGGQIYNFENQRVTAAMIPWVWPDPMPLRTGNLRAPGRCGALLRQRNDDRRNCRERRRRPGGVPAALSHGQANY